MNYEKNTKMNTNMNMSTSMNANTAYGLRLTDCDYGLRITNSPDYTAISGGSGG